MYHLFRFAFASAGNIFQHIFTQRFTDGAINCLQSSVLRGLCLIARLMSFRKNQN
jgi:hypothetical protein